VTFSRQPSPTIKPESDMDSAKNGQRKETAKAWFETLRKRILSAFETLEDALPASAPFGNHPAGRFTHTQWSRTDHTGAPAAAASWR